MGKHKRKLTASEKAEKTRRKTSKAPGGAGRRGVPKSKSNF